MKIEMHVHTTNSDGIYNVEEVLEFAKEKNLDIFSITDHDIILDLKDLVAKYSFRFIPGIEFTTNYKRVHILGYGIENIDFLNKVATKYRDLAEEKVYNLAKNLVLEGYPITIESVYKNSKNNRITINSICRALVEENIFSSIDEAKKATKLDEVTLPRISIEEAISKIQMSGGKAVLAHPYFSGFKENNLEEEIKKIMEYGLDGIESYYMRSTKSQIRNMIKFAKDNNLIMTVGSDFHGYGTKNNLGVELNF